MDEATHDRICEAYRVIWEQVQADPEYVHLLVEAARLEELYETAVAGLTQEEREAVELYLTCRESMARRMLEVACEEIVDLK